LIYSARLGAFRRANDPLSVEDLYAFSGQVTCEKALGSPDRRLVIMAVGEVKIGNRTTGMKEIEGVTPHSRPPDHRAGPRTVIGAASGYGVESNSWD
jgi:hypothetical protein